MHEFGDPKGGRIKCSVLVNDAGSHGVAGCYAGHDGSIGNTQIFDSIELEIGVYDGHGVTPHFGGTRLMPEGND
jgi:hypothetical protein